VLLRISADSHSTCSCTVAVPVTFRGVSPDGATVFVALHVYRPASVLSRRLTMKGSRPSCTTTPSRSHHVASGMTGGLATTAEQSILTEDPSTADQSDVGISFTCTDTETFGPSEDPTTFAILLFITELKLKTSKFSYCFVFMLTQCYATATIVLF